MSKLLLSKLENKSPSKSLPIAEALRNLDQVDHIFEFGQTVVAHSTLTGDMILSVNPSEWKITMENIMVIERDYAEYNIDVKITTLSTLCDCSKELNKYRMAEELNYGDDYCYYMMCLWVIAQKR